MNNIKIEYKNRLKDLHKRTPPRKPQQTNLNSKKGKLKIKFHKTPKFKINLTDHRTKEKRNKYTHNKIIELNIRETRAKYCELTRRITYYCAAVICLQESHLKDNNTINIRNCQSYTYIKGHTDRDFGGSSVFIKNNIPHSEIQLNINMQAVAESATLRKTVTVCSLYICHQMKNSKNRSLAN